MMGTDFVREYGSMPLYNCGFTLVESVSDLHWIMDCLMCGVGIGFKPVSLTPSGEAPPYWAVPDTRTGWCDSVVHLVNAPVEIYINQESNGVTSSLEIIDQNGGETFLRLI